MKRSSLKVRRLARKELPRHTLELARFLIGKVVVRELPEGRLSGRIVEAEGYPPGDPAGHHFRGPTQRNRSLFLRHGHVYVFFNYGMHFMLNVSSERAGVGGGVLIRALEPLEGIELMQRHRKIAELLGLTRAVPDGLRRRCGSTEVLMDLIYFRAAPSGSEYCCLPKPISPASHPWPKRELQGRCGIGITHAADKLFRFYERGNPFVSGPKRLLLPNPAKKKANG